MKNQTRAPGKMNIVWLLLGLGILLFLSSPKRAWANQTLSGHVPSIVAHLTPKGLLPATNRLNLAIGLPLRHAAELKRCLSDIYNPASPNFHHYLTPEQFTERFGPTTADYQAVIAFAQKHHLAVTHTHGNRLLLDVNGAAADVQSALHVTLKMYRHPTEARDFYAPDIEPSVDTGLPVADISGLNNYARPHPRSLKMNAAAPAVSAAPRFGSGTGGSYFGKDFRAAYLPGTALTGAGQTVGLLEFDSFYTGDITAYETKAGLPVVPLQTVLVDNYNGVSESTGGNIEVSLDIEMVVAMAPGLAGIVVFEGDGNNLQPNDVLNTIAASNQVSQISSSWGWSGGPDTTTDNIFKQMAAQGQTFFNASGDSDAFTTGAGSINGVDNPSLVNTPSSCPFITMVGGTTLTTTGPGGSWSSETTWNWGAFNGGYAGSSGGISSFYSIPDWQTNVDMTANGGSSSFRNIPDVALTADNILVYYGQGTNGVVGGTSCAAPLWAGLTALMNEQSLAAGRSTLGFVNPAIYALGGTTGYTTNFHDITTGNNVWPQSSATNDFDAVAGYDLCTGWGTPAGNSLVNALAGAPESLQILPDTGYTITGQVGGPFSPLTNTFTVTNFSAGTLNWSIGGLPGWLTVNPAGGTLLPHTSTSVTTFLKAAAGVLPAGNYVATLVFSNLTSGIRQTRPLSLQVGSSLVQNGGFETGDFSSWTLVGNGIVPAGFGSVNIYNGALPATAYPAAVHSGNYGAFLGDVSLATLSQNLPTMPGQSYLLSFWLDNPVSGGSQQFLVNWNTNATSTSQIYYLTNPPVFTWTNPTFVLTATSTNTVLQFGAENPPNFFGLDDISVTPIPVPSFTAGTLNSNALSLTWYAVAGVSYQVLYSTNLTPTNWLVLTTNTATASTLSLTNNLGSDPRRFYRIRRLP